MKAALFMNFSKEPFTGHWNNSGMTFQPGESKWMEDWRAQHYAKHLANRELIRDGYETHTSPKKPSENPLFMEYFNKAFIEQDGEEQTTDEATVDMINKQKQAFCDSCDSKGVRHKKDCPKNQKPEDEFEGKDN